MAVARTQHLASARLMSELAMVAEGLDKLHWAENSLEKEDSQAEGKIGPGSLVARSGVGKSQVFVIVGCSRWFEQRFATPVNRTVSRIELDPDTLAEVDTAL